MERNPLIVPLPLLQGGANRLGLPFIRQAEAISVMRKPMRKQRNRPGRTPLALLLLLTATALVSTGGCKSGPSNSAPPTPEAAKAFKGAPPTAADREDMKKEEAAAAEYRRAHPNDFPTASSSPK